MDSGCSVSSTPTDYGHGDYGLDNNGDHDNESPELLHIPMKLQMEKAFAVEEPRRPQTKTATTMNLVPKRQIPMDYFCRHMLAPIRCVTITHTVISIQVFSTNKAFSLDRLACQLASSFVFFCHW
jgi:hypothetical protein